MIISESYFAVSLLTFVNMINYMDRYVIAAVLPQVKSFYDLNDKQGGLLQTVFILSYMLMAPIFGYLGDRYSRKYLMAGGIFFWSLMTVISSLVPSHHAGTFFFFRALIGVGEASYSAISPTLISDFFTGTMRTKMLGIFYLAIPVGSGFGYVAGAELASIFDNWKYSLRLTPFLGLLSTFLMIFFLQEPPRGHSDGVQKVEKSNIESDLKYFATVPSYIWSSIGFTCVCFTSGSLAWWAPTYVILATKALRDTQQSLTSVTDESINLIFGCIITFAGIAGVIFGTLSAQHLRLKTDKADPLICSGSVFASVPFIFASLFFAPSSPVLTWICITFGITLLCINWTLVADMLLYLIVPHRRSFAQSIQIMFSHLFGDATSPYIVGIISDAIKNEKNPTNMNQAMSLQYALYINCFVLVLGGVAFLYTSFFIAKDQERTKALMKGNRSRSNSTTQTDVTNEVLSSPQLPSARLKMFQPQLDREEDTAHLVA
ncbi:lysolipid transporter protein spinster [Brevipalpus obovatus]|uniref:lysolipid transporter protein spinster n=1 Tax=Brevipalpus obovatus TaxID=246614 RepID=UPI003D9ECABA